MPVRAHLADHARRLDLDRDQNQRGSRSVHPASVAALQGRCLAQWLRMLFAVSSGCLWRSASGVSNLRCAASLAHSILSFPTCNHQPAHFCSLLCLWVVGAWRVTDSVAAVSCDAARLIRALQDVGPHEHLVGSIARGLFSTVSYCCRGLGLRRGGSRVYVLQLRRLCGETSRVR